MKYDIDTTTLTQAISIDSPCGNNLREDTSVNSLYYQIKDRRQVARDAERCFSDDNNQFQANTHWQVVFQLTTDCLQHQSKDIEITAWLIESLLRINGIRGLSQGFKLAQQLIENFWPHLYPLLIDNNSENRMAPLVGLNGDDYEGALILPIAWQAITSDGTMENYALWQYQQSLSTDKCAEEMKQKRYQDGVIPLNKILKAALNTPATFYQRLEYDIQQALNHYSEYVSTLEKHCADINIPSSHITHALHHFKDHISYLIHERPQDTVKLDNMTTGDLLTPVDDTLIESSTDNTLRIENRAHALQTLNTIAYYFAAHEPHSPISYMIKRIVRWSQLSLPELLKELIDDPSCQSVITSMTGIPLISKES